MYFLGGTWVLVQTADTSTCVAGSALLHLNSHGTPCRPPPKLISGSLRHYRSHSPITSYNISLLRRCDHTAPQPCHLNTRQRRVLYHHARYYITPTSPLDHSPSLLYASNNHSRPGPITCLDTPTPRRNIVPSSCRP